MLISPDSMQALSAGPVASTTFGTMLFRSCIGVFYRTLSQNLWIFRFKRILKEVVIRPVNEIENGENSWERYSRKFVDIIDVLDNRKLRSVNRTFAPPIYLGFPTKSFISRPWKGREFPTRAVRRVNAAAILRIVHGTK